LLELVFLKNPLCLMCHLDYQLSKLLDFSFFVSPEEKPPPPPGSLAVPPPWSPFPEPRFLMFPDYVPLRAPPTRFLGDNAPPPFACLRGLFPRPPPLRNVLPPRHCRILGRLFGLSMGFLLPPPQIRSFSPVFLTFEVLIFFVHFFVLLPLTNSSFPPLFSPICSVLFSSSLFFFASRLVHVWLKFL